MLNATDAINCYSHFNRTYFACIRTKKKRPHMQTKSRFPSYSANIFKVHIQIFCVCLKNSCKKTRKKKLTFSSVKLRQPSRGTNAANFFPFFISCTRTHFRMAELGCFASIPLWFRVVIRQRSAKCFFFSVSRQTIGQTKQTKGRRGSKKTESDETNHSENIYE